MTSIMSRIALVVSLVALGGTILPSVLFMLDRMELPQVHFWMLVATVAWYITAPLWMDRPEA
ncbi:MAG: hypothetical protein ACRD09_13350 [Vicinamibacterales bacterium]